MTDIAPDIWAKSPYGSRIDGESLDHHSRQVVHKLLELNRRTPGLADWLEEPRLWHRAFWACFLHDFGKLAAGFQAQLRSGPRWGHRHEVLSLAFLHWVTPIEGPDYAWMAAAIASHHKDAGLEAYATQGSRKTLFSYYYPLEDVGSSYSIEKRLRDLVTGGDGESITVEKLIHMTRILKERIPELYEEYHLARLGIEQSLNIPNPLEIGTFIQEAPEYIYTALCHYRSLVRDKLILQAGNTLDNRQAVALRGLVLLSDRLASSGAVPINLAELPDAPTLFARLNRPFSGLRDHQQQAARLAGSMIMTAPTGSGKTEAALLWARNQQELSGIRPNLVYILPYQASMNAMHERLRNSLFADKAEANVALMHGRSTQVLYNQLLTPATTTQDAERTAKRAKSMAGLYQPSVWVTTPYQLLKAAYRLPGYEMLWTAVAGSRLIIDEVHAYDSQRLGLFIGMLSFLKKYWAVEICTMTATMPGWLRGLLQERLNIRDTNMIAPVRALFAHFRRHRLQRLPGKLDDPAVQSFIIEMFKQNKSVLVCANSVKGAQQTVTLLRQQLTEIGLNPQQVILLHSRFTGNHRQAKEKTIKKEVNADRTDKSNALIVVATQVIEVSLDLDFTTIVSEPAPLEALAQRFGRVNRRGDSTKPPAPVYVLTEALDTRVNELIYDPGLLLRTLELIEREDGQEIDEAQLTNWINEIYGDDLASLYRQEVLSAERDFQRACLDNLRAFQSDEELEDSFDRLFDGVEVLPLNQKSAYEKALNEDSALAASAYLVPISHQQYRIQRAKGTITPETFVVAEGDGETHQDSRIKTKVLIADLPYDEDTGLSLS